MIVNSTGKHNAFTLVELLIVVVIIGTLSGMMSLGADAIFIRSNATRCQNDRKVLEKEYMLKRISDSGKLWYTTMKHVAEAHGLAFNGSGLIEACPSGKDYFWVMGNDNRTLTKS